MPRWVVVIHTCRYTQQEPPGTPATNTHRDGSVSRDARDSDGHVYDTHSTVGGGNIEGSRTTQPDVEDTPASNETATESAGTTELVETEQ